MKSDDKRIIYKPPIVHVANDDKCNKVSRIMCSMIGAFTATTLVHGFDVIRISQQTNIKPKYTFNYLYRGYTSGLMRQLTYSVPNITIFSELVRQYKDIHDTEPSLLYKTGFGAVSGAIGGFFGTPSEVILVRSINPTIPRAGIVTHANNIYNVNGFKGFINGAYASTTRSALFNSIRLSVYSESKTRIQELYPNLEGTSTLHFTSAICGTSLGIFASNPIDYIKSQVQTPGNTKTVSEIVKNTYQHNGIFGFYKGTIASLCKSIPHSVISFVIIERLMRIFTGHDAI